MELKNFNSKLSVRSFSEILEQKWPIGTENFKHLKIRYDNEIGPVICINDGLYEFDCHNLSNSARVLDFIFQIHGKSWCTPEIIHELLWALEKVCEEKFDNSVQGVFCPNGKDHQVEW